jgi:hypothetical protein
MKSGLHLGVFLLASFSIFAFACWSQMLGNEFVFRSTVAWLDGKPVRSTKVVEWHLKIPSEFVRKTEGYYSNVFELDGAESRWNRLWRRFPDGASILEVLASVNAKDEVVPLISDTGASQHFSIQLKNTLGESRKFPGNYCITEDEREKAYKTSGKRTGCLDSYINCRVFLNYHGWSVVVGVARERLYKEPERVCEIVKKTLSAWTKSVDDIGTP